MNSKDRNKRIITMANRLEDKYSALVTISDIARWTGRSRDWVRINIIKGMKYIPGEKSRLYYSFDVAERLVEMMVED